MLNLSTRSNKRNNKMEKIRSNNIIGLKELRLNFDKYIESVKKGNYFAVMKRSEPVFKIVPFDVDIEGEWETVIDFTEIDPRGVPVEKVLAALDKLS